MNKIITLLVVFLLVLSPFTVAEISVSEVIEDCNWWCKTLEVLFGSSNQRAVVGTG